MTHPNDPRWKTAVTNDDPADLAADIFKRGTNHPSFQALIKSWNRIADGLEEAKKESDSLHRMGVYNEDPRIFGRKVLSQMEAYEETLQVVLRQLKMRLEI